MSGMSIWEILLLGVGLSMDAFAVSICKGLSVKKVKWQHLLCVGAYFGIFQALTATLMVDLVLIGLHIFVLGDSMSLADAIVLGAIATATAPAATLMVVRQYKANGPVTRMLLPVVAMDDALGLMLYAIMMAIARTLDSGAALSVMTLLVKPLMSRE